ncbi:MAG: NAD(P)-dependent oxidoreductase [Myxococcota bacterium]
MTTPTNSRRWLVTGGAGFFGRRMCSALQKLGQQVVVLDIASQKDTTPIQYIQGSVTDPAIYRSQVPGVDIVVHAATALPLHPKSRVQHVISQGTLQAVRYAEERRLHCIVLSTTAVYSPYAAGPHKEDAPTAGIYGPYALAKVEAENHCKRALDRGAKISLVRPKTFIGPGRLGLFSLLCDWVLAGKKVPILGAGQNRYQLLDVDDLVEAVWQLANASEFAAGIFNVGAKSFGTVLQDLSSLCMYAGTGASVRPVPAKATQSLLRMFYRMGLSPLYPWVYETCDRDHMVDTSKIEETLGFVPRFSNLDALTRTFDWYRLHGRYMPHRRGHDGRWRQGLLGMFRALS